MVKIPGLDFDSDELNKIAERTGAGPGGRASERIRARARILAGGA